MTALLCTAGLRMTPAAYPSVLIPEREYLSESSGFFWERAEPEGQNNITCHCSTGGTLSASWQQAEGYVSLGYRQPNETRSLENYAFRYSMTDTSIHGLSYYGFHGTLSEPHAEFYLIDGWAMWRPTNNAKPSPTIVDPRGNRYEVYRTKIEPETPGADPYWEYWCVRYENTSQKGTFTGQYELSLSPFFTALRQCGFPVGQCDEVDVRVISDRTDNNVRISDMAFQPEIFSSSSPWKAYDASGNQIDVPVTKPEDSFFTNADIGYMLSYMLCKPDSALTAYSALQRDRDDNEILDARDLTLMKQMLLERSGGRRTVWQDNFDDDLLDTQKWDYETGNWLLDADGNKITEGWGNNEQQCYTENNASIENGILRIEARQEDFTHYNQGKFSYTSARLTTKRKFSVCGGKISVRARCDSGKSLWPAIWMLPAENVYGTWPNSGELDIMEGWGSDPSRICGTIHYGNPWPNNTYRTQEYKFPAGTSTEDWHVYSVEWENDAIRWYVDGRLYHEESNWMADLNPYFPDTPETAFPFDQEFYLILNLAVGGTFDGIDGVAADPATFADGRTPAFEIDYVIVEEPKAHVTSYAPKSAPLRLYTEDADARMLNFGDRSEIVLGHTGEKEYGVMALLENCFVYANEPRTLSFDCFCTIDREILITAEDAAYNRIVEKRIQVTPNAAVMHFDIPVSVEQDMFVDLKFQLGYNGTASDGFLPDGMHRVILRNVQFN